MVPIIHRRNMSRSKSENNQMMYPSRPKQPEQVGTIIYSYDSPSETKLYFNSESFKTPNCEQMEECAAPLDPPSLPHKTK